MYLVPNKTHAYSIQLIQYEPILASQLADVFNKRGKITAKGIVFLKI